ncbi:MAG: ADP-ribosylglycohydrolase family protein [Muribaculaceae bacterium]|nr:ADP-ribosylglycohydrolase family protein [Muribaculaceae bacterium]
MTKDKLKGCLYGFAIGDALGLGTVFMTREEAAIRYPQGLTSFSQIIKDVHRNLYTFGEYSTCTTYVLLMAESMIESSGLDASDYARRLQNWYTSEYHHDVAAHMRWIMSYPDFINDPYTISRHIQETMHYRESSNEALGRALIAGLWPEYNEEEILKNSDLTNWGSLSDACAAVISAMSHSLFRHNEEMDYNLLCEIANRINPELLPYLEIAADGDLDELDLDDEDTASSAPKALAAALWGLWHHSEHPVEALVNVISHGGDANTTGALTFALLGLKYGFSALPDHLTNEIVGRENLDEIVDKLHTILDGKVK